MKKVERGNHYIKEWRIFRGLSLRKLADRLEVEDGGKLLADYSQLSRIVKGEYQFSEDILNALAVALDVTREDLLSKNPNKDGEVIDLLRKMDERDRERILEMMRVMTKTA